MTAMTDKEQKRKDAFYIFYESVLKPDPDLSSIKGSLLISSGGDTIKM